mmetsp:Transcript_31546/g.36440  ORF Transcript_31546/g.36440 Transcript_31546/m.36440 type:complete len:92 (-) Transcript_31546:132-407(-)
MSYPTQNNPQNMRADPTQMQSYDPNPRPVNLEGLAQVSYPWDPRFQNNSYDYPPNPFFGSYSQQPSMPIGYNSNMYNMTNYNPFFGPFPGN